MLTVIFSLHRTVHSSFFYHLVTFWLRFISNLCFRSNICIVFWRQLSSHGVWFGSSTLSIWRSDYYNLTFVVISQQEPSSHWLDSSPATVLLPSSLAFWFSKACGTVSWDNHTLLCSFSVGIFSLWNVVVALITSHLCICSCKVFTASSAWFWRCTLEDHRQSASSPLCQKEISTMRRLFGPSHLHWGRRYQTKITVVYSVRVFRVHPKGYSPLKNVVERFSRCSCSIKKWWIE